MTKEYLQSLHYEELLELYDKYYNMGQNILKYDVNQGLAILDIADFIQIEIKRRQILDNGKKKKLKK